MSQKIPPRRVPRDRFAQARGASGGYTGPSVPGAHTHLEADITDLDKYTQAAADAKFVEVGGDTMTGLLVLSAGPSADLGAATKKFVDDHNWLEADITDLQAYLLNITGEPLGDLSNVTITAIASGELLKWNGSAFVNNTLAEAGISATGHTHTESDITDLQAYLLDITNEALETLSDVTISGIASGEVLKWNGSAWINQTLAEAGISATGHTHTESEITDLGAYLLLSGGTLSGDLTLTTAQLNLGNTTSGFPGLPRFILSGDAGGWARGWHYYNSSLAIIGGIGALGSGDTFTYAYLGYGASPHISANALTVASGVIQFEDTDVSLDGHTHVEADITDLDRYTVAGADAAFAAISHTHLEADITDLQAYLLDITAEALGTLSDVTITAIASGELLKWNGSAFINNTLAEAGISATGHTHLEADITDLKAYLEKAGGTMTGTIDWLEGSGSTALNLDSSSGNAPLLLWDNQTYQTGLRMTTAGELVLGTGFFTVRLKINQAGLVTASAGLNVSSGVMQKAGVDVSLAGHTHLEADITDLQSYLVSPLTTDGDILYYNSGHQRLAKGSDDEVLTLASGVPTWAAAGGGYTDPLTTDGDILIRDTTTKRLAKGSDDQVLTLASGLPVWAAAAGGVTDHGALTGLADDDHDQYALIAGDTFTGAVTVQGNLTLNNTLAIAEVAPFMQWNETDAATDEAKWDQRWIGGTFDWRTVNDAYSAAATIMSVTRTGITVDTINFGGTNLTHGGTAISLAGHTHLEADITDHAAYLLLAGGTVTGAVTFTGAAPGLQISHTRAQIQWEQTDASTDNKGWSIRADDEQFTFKMHNDAFSNSSSWLTVDRTGFATADSVLFNTTTLLTTEDLLVNDDANTVVIALPNFTGLLVRTNPIATEVVTGLWIQQNPSSGDYDQGVAIQLGNWQTTNKEYTSRIVHYGKTSATRASQLAFDVHTGTQDVWWEAFRIFGNGTLRTEFHEEIRILDSGGTDYAKWTHNGTDFNLDLVNTTEYNINGATEFRTGMHITPTVDNTYTLGKIGVTWLEGHFDDVRLTDAGSVISFPNNNGGSIWTPGGANHYASDSSKTGAITILIPNDALGDMMSFSVTVFEYVTNKSFTLQVSGYAYQTGGSNEWVNESAHIVQDPGSSENYTVRFGHDGTNHLIYIGELADVWAYPQVQVFNFMSGYTTSILDYTDGWDVYWEASAFENIDATLTDITVGAGGGGISVTVSTSAASGGGSDGDLWCRV